MRTRSLTFAALMAALSNILSLPPFVIPITVGSFSTAIHLTQLPVFLCGTMVGPLAGLIAGGVGGLYMSFSTGIPFIIGGLALLGASAGYARERLGLSPFLSSLLAFGVQTPYVFLTDYFWFTLTGLMPPAVARNAVTTIVLKLTIEALIAASLVKAIIPLMKRAGINLQK
ncbi:ECF transporter S component [Thermoproteota archaeon]